MSLPRQKESNEDHTVLLGMWKAMNTPLIMPKKEETDKLCWQCGGSHTHLGRDPDGNHLKFAGDSTSNIPECHRVDPDDRRCKDCNLKIDFDYRGWTTHKCPVTNNVEVEPPAHSRPLSSVPFVTRPWYTTEEVAQLNLAVHEREKEKIPKPKESKNRIILYEQVRIIVHLLYSNSNQYQWKTYRFSQNPITN